MASNYLSKLSLIDRDNLINDLWSIQGGKCFISDDKIDRIIHKDLLDIDHVIPSKMGGKDEPSNFALTFSTANRSKQASDLKLARILHRFKKIQDNLKEEEDRSPNLNDILQTKQGSKYKLTFKIENNHISYSLAKSGNNSIVKSPIFKDKLSGLDYFFAVLPIEYVFHDDKLNPRSIGSNISKLIDEFYQGNPQLHISLGWIDINNSSDAYVKIFDGQHKAAA